MQQKGGKSYDGAQSYFVAVYIASVAGTAAPRCAFIGHSWPHAGARAGPGVHDGFPGAPLLCADSGAEWLTC